MRRRKMDMLRRPDSRSMRRAVAILFAASLLGSFVVGAAGAETEGTRYLVGYDKANAQQAVLSIELAGGTVERTSPELGFAVVRADNSDAFLFTVRSSPYIQYVESDDRTSLAGAQWNGAQWNGA